MQERESDMDVDTSTELEEIDKESFTLDFRKPEDCKSMKELSELAKARGYKPGWAYFQAKRLNILN